VTCPRKLPLFAPCWAVAAALAWTAPAFAETSSSNAKRIDTLAESAKQLKPAEIDKFVAGLTDELARGLLRHQLTAEATERNRAQAEAGARESRMAARLRAARANLLAWPGDFLRFPAAVDAAVAALSAEAGSGPIYWIVGAALCASAGALAAFFAARLVERGNRHLLARATRTGETQQLLLALARLFLELMTPLVFVAMAYAAFVGWHPEGRGPSGVFGALAGGIAVFLVLSALTRGVLSREDSRLRLITMPDAAANAIFSPTIGAAAALAAAFGLNVWFRRWEVETGPARAVLMAAAVVVAMLLLAAIWRVRRNLARAGAGAQLTTSNAGMPAVATAAWPWIASLFVLLVLAVGIVHLLAGSEAARGAAILSLAIIPAAFLLDHIVRGLLAALARRQVRALGVDASAAAETAPARPGMAASGDAQILSGWTVLAHLCRLLIALVALIAFFDIWGLSFFDLFADSVGSHLARAILTTLVIGSLAYLAYGWARAWFNRRIAADASRREHADPAAAIDRKSRFESLLPVLRAISLATIAVTALLMILSNLGVDIGPLIAGAGIVGLAVGFGAQTLVRNVIQGTFFLIDDAFRVGEYIEVDRIKGTVEKISLTSMRLRHQRGALHTLPYGGIRSITNLSRDWVIHKLEFRLPYGTDIEKVRKLLKRVGAELEADPEFADGIMMPLKSQGVSRMDESALIFSAKFMSKPDDKQFAVRREAYRRIQQVLYENGIEFAPHRVVVDVAERRAADRGGEMAAAGAITVVQSTKPAAAD